MQPYLHIQLYIPSNISEWLSLGTAKVAIPKSRARSQYQVYLFLIWKAEHKPQHISKQGQLDRLCYRAEPNYVFSLPRLHAEDGWE